MVHDGERPKPEMTRFVRGPVIVAVSAGMGCPGFGHRAKKGRRRLQRSRRNVFRATRGRQCLTGVTRLMGAVASSTHHHAHNSYGHT